MVPKLLTVTVICRAFPTDWDTYEGLNLCDVLITDYSSVFYDYANTGKKVVFFAYDRAEYESTLRNV